MSKYTVMRYVPDPVRGEYVNVGVIATGNDQVRFRFSDTKRAKRLNAANIEALEDVIEDFRCAIEAPGELARGMQQINDEFLAHIATNWQNCIQFSQPQGSSLGVDELIEDVASVFLAKSSEQQHHRYRDRRAAASMAFAGTRGALAQLGADVSHLLRRGGEVGGYIKPHRFDAVVGGATPRLCVHGLSYEDPGSAGPDPALDSALLSITDSLRVLNRLRFLVVVLPPGTRTDRYEEAVKALGRAGAVTVPATETEAAIPDIKSAIEPVLAGMNIQPEL